MARKEKKSVGRRWGDEEEGVDSPRIMRGRQVGDGADRSRRRASGTRRPPVGEEDDRGGE